MTPVRDPQPGLSDFASQKSAFLEPLVESKLPASASSGQEVKTLFMVSRQNPVTIQPIDENGNRGTPIPMKGASRHLVTTKAGTVWLALDEEGKTVAVFKANKLPTTVGIE